MLKGVSTQEQGGQRRTDSLSYSVPVLAALVGRFQPDRAMMLVYVMRWKHPFPYDADPTVRLGQQIGDAIFALLLIYFVWGVFWPLLKRFF